MGSGASGVRAIRPVNTMTSGGSRGAQPLLPQPIWRATIGTAPRVLPAPTVSSSTTRHALTDADAARRADARTYTITELAQEFDITPRAIRFYEDLGLLSPTRQGRSRVYGQRDRTRLKLTLRGKRLGFSLQEIRQLVTMYDTESDTVPQLQAFLATLSAHREALAQQLDDIRVTLEEIGLHEARCRQLLAQARTGRGRR